MPETTRLHTALDEVQDRADEIAAEIAWQIDGLEADLARIRERRAAIARLESKREQYEALIAEVHEARTQRLHATYVVREPVVIIPREPEPHRAALRAVFPGAAA